MGKSGRKLWWGAGVLVVLGGLAFVVPAAATGPVYAEAGILHLQLDATDDNLRYDPTSGSNLVQNLDPASATSCVLTSSGDDLIDFSSTGTKPSNAGIKDHRIGVGQKGEGNGEPCVRINKDLTQKLTLTLGDALAGKKISYAEIDLGFKFDGSAQISAFDGANEVDINGSLAGKAVVVNCTGSDCGPDSGADDNLRAIIGIRLPITSGTPVVFDRVVIEAITPPSGAVSLEGGFAGTERGPLGIDLGTADTLFQIVRVFDGELNCGDTVTTSAGAVSGTFTRLPNVSGTCTAKPYILNITTGTGGPVLTFIPEGDQAAVYRGFVTFGPYAPANPTGADIEYDQDGDGPGGFELMQWCISPAFDPTGNVTSATLPPTESWCIASENTQASGTNIVTVWQLFGNDDPKYR